MYGDTWGQPAPWEKPCTMVSQSRQRAQEKTRSAWYNIRDKAHPTHWASRRRRAASVLHTTTTHLLRHGQTDRHCRSHVRTILCILHPLRYDVNKRVWMDRGKVGTAEAHHNNRPRIKKNATQPKQQHLPTKNYVEVRPWELVESASDSS